MVLGSALSWATFVLAIAVAQVSKVFSLVLQFMFGFEALGITFRV